MSIPLDRLYHYIESIAQDIRKDNVVIYRFWPHGSKKLEDLSPVRYHTNDALSLLPHIICYDQEPLNYQLYELPSSIPEIKLAHMLEEGRKIYQKINLDKYNLRNYPGNIYDHAVLIHSECRSFNVEEYNNNNFIPVYYWSHGLIARDWFRFAEHVQQKKKVKQLFLVYNRAWSGTREYRLGFADRLISMDLVDHVVMRVSPIDSTLNKHYDLHNFEHVHWRPHNVIEDYFPLCQAESHYSADFDQEDYESTEIEVVLETLFDDHRLHLTEKTLRPIAMGQPFILAGTHGSLRYLRDYGFKTFDSCWDESYDTMIDSVERMNAIMDTMNSIVHMLPNQRQAMLVQARAIADYNRQHFFSDKFQNQICDELRNNLEVALSQCENLNTGQRFVDRRKKMLANADYKKYTNQNKKIDADRRKNFAFLLKAARKYKLRTLPPT